MRRVLTQLLSLLAGLGLGLVLAEVLLRVLHFAPSNSVATVTEAEFRTVPGIWAPGQDLIDRRNAHLPYHVSTDSLGYRGPSFPAHKPPGEWRVLLTGDSFAFGDFVDDTGTLPAQLERALRAHCPGARVVNAGLDAATIVDEAPMAERGLVVSPDLVLLLFSENDIADLGRQSTWDELAANRRSKARFPLSLAYPVLRRTALWNFALALRATIAVRRHPVRVDWTAAGSTDSETPRLRARYRDALVALRDSLSARGVPLVAVAYPSHHAIRDTALRGQIAWFKEMAGTEHIPVIDLLPPLAASHEPMTRLYLLPYDGHPSAEGYGISAAYIADRLTVGGSCRAVPAVATRPVSRSGVGTR